jgi:hypothetical protein
MVTRADSLSISSSDGWNTIQFHINGVNEEILCRIVGTGDFWARSKNFETESAKLVDEFRLEFNQAVLAKEKLALFKEKLGQWFESPDEIRMEISPSKYPLISVSIGESADFVSSATKPVFSLTYKDSRVETKLSFVTDQSCLHLLLEDLNKLLKDRTTTKDIA